MFCNFCIKAEIPADKTNFIQGCKSLKLESVKHNECSNMHLFAANKHINEENPSEAPAFKAQMSLNKLAMDRLTLLFYNVYAINLQGCPAHDYRWLNKLDVVKGLNTGKVYKTEVKAQEFAAVITHVLRTDVANYLANCKFVAVTVDSSMDSSVIDNEVVYIQTCHEGLICTNFIHCCQVERGDAKGVVQAIHKAIKTVTGWDEFKSKLVALGSDGASVMLGKNNGVIAKLQAEEPSMIAVHCSGHHLELAYEAVIKHLPFAEKVTTLQTGLYYMYRNNPLNRANLKHAFKCLGLKVLLPT